MTLPILLDKLFAFFFLIPTILAAQPWDEPADIEGDEAIDGLDDINLQNQDIFTGDSEEAWDADQLLEGDQLALPADPIVLPPEPIALVNVLAQQPILRLISCLQHKLLISLLAARRWRLVEADGGASTEAPQGDTSQPVISSHSPHPSNHTLTVPRPLANATSQLTHHQESTASPSLRQMDDREPVQSSNLPRSQTNYTTPPPANTQEARCGELLCDARLASWLPENHELLNSTEEGPLVPTAAVDQDLTGPMAPPSQTARNLRLQMPSDNDLRISEEEASQENERVRLVGVQSRGDQDRPGSMAPPPRAPHLRLQMPSLESMASPELRSPSVPSLTPTSPPNSQATQQPQDRLEKERRKRNRELSPEEALDCEWRTDTRFDGKPRLYKAKKQRSQ